MRCAMYKYNNSVFFVIGYALSLCVNCTILHSNKTVIDPVSIVVVDESRIDNIRVRHIFREFLVREIIREGNNKVTVFISDSTNLYSGLPESLDYKVSFDIMDYGIHDIMEQTDKLLASIKISKYQGDCAILSSCIKSCKGNDVEMMCGYVTKEMSSVFVKKLIALNERTFSVPNVYSEDEDTSVTLESKAVTE